MHHQGPLLFLASLLMESVCKNEMRNRNILYCQTRSASTIINRGKSHIRFIVFVSLWRHLISFGVVCKNIGLYLYGNAHNMLCECKASQIYVIFTCLIPIIIKMIVIHTNNCILVYAISFV